MRCSPIVRTRLTIVLLALTTVLSACGGAPTTALNAATPDTAIPVESRQQWVEFAVPSRQSFAGTHLAPEFPPVEWLNTGRPLSIADLRGKVVLLDFWTYGCIDCLHAIPDLQLLEAKYADELVVIGVHSAKFAHEGNTDSIRQIILRYELEHPVINDRDFEVWRTYGAQAWPTFILIDPAGNIAGSHSSDGIYDSFDHIIGSLVAEFDAQGQIDRTPLELRLEREGVPETLLSFPSEVLADIEGQRLFVADSNHNRILVAHLETYEIQQVIGGPERGFTDGDFASARFFRPQGMALSTDGRTLYVADTQNHAIRAVNLVNETVATIAGTGQQARNHQGSAGRGTEVALDAPWDLALVDDQLYVAMAGAHQLWRMGLSVGSKTGVIRPWAGSGQEGIGDGELELASLAEPSGLATDGERIYFADSEASAIRVAVPERGDRWTVQTIVGTGLFEFGDVDGVGDQVRLQHPLGVAYNPADGLLYVADTYNGRIKTLDPNSRQVETFLGGDGHGWRDGAAPLFYEPSGLDLAGGRLYVADTNNHAVRVVDLATRETLTIAFRDVNGLLMAHGDAQAADDYAGEMVMFDVQQVSAGAGLVRLNVVLPNGYKVNDLAPSSIVWQTNGLITFRDGGPRRRMPGPRFPLEFPVIFRAGGRGTISLDLTLYYCEAKKESLCLIHRIRLQVPLEIGDAEGATLELDYNLPEPKI